jgi:antitoxin (DNA-binding transcriptional repressor) of toxin-antitoxin stability system
VATTVNIHEAKTHLSKLVERAAKGEEIIIAKAGKPIARLNALDALSNDTPRRRGFGSAKNLFTGAEIKALLDPALDKEIEDMFYNGPPRSSDLEPRQRMGSDSQAGQARPDGSVCADTQFRHR